MDLAHHDTASPRRAARRDRAAKTREAHIHIRASVETKALIERAAAAVGKSLSEFTLDLTRKGAVDVLLDQRLFELDSKQFDAFSKALDNPPPAGPKLRALMHRRPLWEK